MTRRRSNPYRATIYGECGHLCAAWPRFLDKVVCHYCTRDNNPDGLDDVWVKIRKRATVVKRKLPNPRPPKQPERTLPLFDLDSEGRPDIPPF